MDGILSLSSEKCIRWKTRLLPDPGTYSASPEFLVQGSEWHLELWPDFIEFSRYYYYYVDLVRENGRSGKRKITKLEKSFKVSTYVQKDDHLLFPSITSVEIDVQRISEVCGNELEERFPDIEDDEEIVIVCLFHLPESDVSCQEEKVEVMTENDFDRPLPVKKLHDAQSSDANLDSLSRDLCKLLVDNVLPDINLKSGDRTVAAHKTILAARSQVFAAMFQSKMLESETGVVDITDIDADVLETFLKYVYSGRLSDLTDESLPSLYAAGDKYDVSALKSTCSERMVSNLTRENCLNILLLANAHSDQDLENAILEFILNQTDILKSQEWMKFRKDNPILSNEVLQFVLQQKLF